MFSQSKHTIWILVLIYTLTIVQVNVRQIEVPALQDYNAINIKLGLAKQIKQPDFEFDRVYRRQVQKVNSQSLVHFMPCSQNKPQVQFDILDQIIFQGIPARPNVITDFDGIKYSQFLLDVYYEDLKVYMIFKNRKVAVITLQSDDKIKDKIVFDITGDMGDSYLEVGYFIKVQNYLLFVNNNFTVLVTETSAAVMPGYYSTPEFESVISLENSTFAVLENYNGITVYYFDGVKVRKVQKIRSPQIIKTSTVRPELEDIVYWKEKKKIIVLDRMNGVKTIQITFKFDPETLPQTSKPDNGQPGNMMDIDPRTSNNTDFTSHFIDVVLTQQIAPTSNCRLLYLNYTTLYVYCGTMTAYDLSKWPRIQQNKLPFPNIQVKQIYQIGDITAFVGRNVFSLLYLQRIVNYYEDGNLDKLIFSNNLFINAYQQGLDIGTFLIIKPYITCYTNDQQYMGLSHLQFKTYAQCNDAYFEKYQVNKQLLGQINDDDVCVYTVYKSINYWKVGEIKTYPFLFAIFGIAIIVVIIVIIFVAKKLKMNRFVTMIEEYSKVNNSDSAKPQHFVQQLQGGNVDANAAQKQGQNKDEKKPSQVELAMHDI